jgi:hypothetical protein
VDNLKRRYSDAHVDYAQLFKDESSVETSRSVFACYLGVDFFFLPFQYCYV